MTATLEQLLALADEAGADRGRAAGSWYFDGNTTDATFAAVLKGLEDGDPAILNTLPSAPLSGEWAGDPTPQSVLDDLGVDYDAPYADDLLTAYEDAFYSASYGEIERVARRHAGSDDAS